MRRRIEIEPPAVPPGQVPGQVLGILGARATASVDPVGRVATPSGARLAWWIGAADRWHRPEASGPTAVTQHRVDGTPVLETSLRVPGGQIVQRAWAAPAGGGEAAVVEIENRSRDAVAVAVVLTGAGGRLAPLAFDGERTVRLGAGPLLLAARVPARVAAGDEAALVTAVTAGEAPAVAPHAGADGLALVFPLAHTATIRLVLPLTALPAGGDDPVNLAAGLADADAVVRGWRSHVDAGARVAVPDDALAAAIVTARTTLLALANLDRPAADAAAVACALDGWGHHDAAIASLEQLLEHQRLGGFVGGKDPAVTALAIAAWAGHARASASAVFAERVAEPVAKAAYRLGKVRSRSGLPGWASQAQLDAAELLDRAGQPDAASLCRSRAGHGAAPGDVAAPTLEAVRALAAAAGSADAGANARFLLAVRRLLVDDDVAGDLRLLPAAVDEWLGQDLELHGFVTRAGRLSAALRWHGPRPAVLWELDHAAGTGGPTSTLRVPGLDPAWSSSEAVGEALLAPVEPAGGLPKVVAPLAAEGTPVDAAPGEGVSFG